ncbi:MAG TPA: biotin--[acetyl-CoA-carboxylase] ligase [Clostridiales bacterium]|nr:biotin--[acetyl-CoA-carboxylase] ligase [Clostridiales bacterium]
MELKQSVLRILEHNRGIAISGTILAKELFVTRSAIWKAIKSLQDDGYIIEAVTNKGYCLVDHNKIVSAESISPYLKGNAKNFTIDFRSKVTSTNTIAKEMAVNGAMEGTVIVANEQTKGRGRLGRDFYSPADSGIYLSIIIRPDLNMEDSLLITTSVAVAVAKAIEEIANVDVKIKWVNDLFINNKKVCGILTEGSMNFENGGLNYAVVGIGINISTNDFPDDIKDIAGPVFDDYTCLSPKTRSLLIATILNNIALCMDSLSDNKYLIEYRKRSFLIGKDIKIIHKNKYENAKVLGIDDKARLIVLNDKGEQALLSSGEVSVRQIN